jgi:ElaB/YqjD/DUF883 family membrane-anchored ribosome-binding protein
MKAEPSAEILDAVAEKISALKDFLAFTEALQQQLKHKNLADIPPLLEERHRLIQKMERVDRETGLDRPDPSLGQNISDPLQRRLDSMVGEMRDLLQTTADLDHECLKEAQALREAIREELAQYRKNSRVARTYVRQRSRQPRFKDTRE